MIPVLESAPDDFGPLPDGDLTSLDGERRAPPSVILHESWTADERAAFGVFLATPAPPPPAGKIIVLVRYERVDGDVVQLLDLADAPVTMPFAVSPRQLRLALLGAGGGLLEQIETFVASPAAPPAARIAWEYATEFRRDDPMLVELAQHLDPPLPPEQIDQLFAVAAGIQ